jgi:hypothetical protein
MRASMSPASQSTATRLFWCALFFVAGLYLCWGHGPRVKPFNQDNQIYFFMAERAAAGVPPHVSLVDHKNSLSTILSGWAIRAGRVVGLDDVMGARVLSMTMAAGTVAGVWLLTLELTGSVPSAVLAAVVMLTFVDFFMQGAMGVRPKIFMAFFLVFALVAFARRRRVTSGVLATASFLCWQPALLVLGSLGAATLVESDRWRKTGRLVAGTVLAMLAYEAYFVAHGALADQLYQNWRMPADIAAYKVDSFKDSIHFVFRVGLWRKDYEWVFSTTFMASLVLAWLWLAVRSRATWRYFREHPVWPATLSCATTALAFTLFNHQAYPDMFFLHPLIAVSCGVVAGGVVEFVGGRARSPRRLLGWALTVAMVAAIVPLLVVRLNYFGGNTRLKLQDQIALAGEVAKLAAKYGPVWAIGCPHLLAFNHMDNQTPYGLLIDPKVRAHIAQLTDGKPYYPLKDGKMPGVILTARGGERKVIPWLPRYYEELPRPDFKSQGIHVWLRRKGVPIKDLGER